MSSSASIYLHSSVDINSAILIYAACGCLVIIFIFLFEELGVFSNSWEIKRDCLLRTKHIQCQLVGHFRLGQVNR